MLVGLHSDALPVAIQNCAASIGAVHPILPAIGSDPGQFGYDGPEHMVARL